MCCIPSGRLTRRDTSLEMASKAVLRDSTNLPSHLAPSLPAKPTFNSSNPFLDSSSRPTCQQQSSQQDGRHGATSSAERPLKSSVRGHKRKGEVEGRTDLKRQKIVEEEENELGDEDDGTTLLTLADQVSAFEESHDAKDEFRSDEVVMPKKAHASRRRDLSAMLERATQQTGGTPSTLPMFKPQRPTEEDEGQNEYNAEPDLQTDSNNQISHYLHEQEMWAQERSGIALEEQNVEGHANNDEPYFDFYHELEEEGLAVVDKANAFREARAPQNGTAGTRWHPPDRETCMDMHGGEQIECFESSDLYDENMINYDYEEALGVKEDIRKVNDGIPLWRGEYRIVDRLGEGTFSSVYKAIDTYHYRYDNRYWREPSPDPLTGRPFTESATWTRQVREKCRERGVYVSGPDRDEYELPKKVYVALKRIYMTSSPERIANELEIMEELRGCRNTIQLITAFRHNDQVFAVMPFHPNDDYRVFYRYLDPPHIRSYFRSLLRALKDIHRRGIIHRDVKPANFLFDYETAHGVVVDFGLAERYEPPSKIQCQHSAASITKPHGSRIKTAVTEKVEGAFYEAAKKLSLPEGRVGFLAQDNRPSIKANRAGTRGFRAPEVLLKCPDQTFAIDIWAVGIMLLSVLCHKFPIFNSSDDVEALMEIGAMFGPNSLAKCAFLHNRTIISNLPSLKEDKSHHSLTNLVLTLNPRLYQPPDPNCSAEEARAHIESMDSAIDLLKKLLAMDATKRYTAHEALMHPFLNNDLPDVEKETEEVIHPSGKGVCGQFHKIEEDGTHWAMVENRQYNLKFSQGVAADDRACSYHCGNVRPYAGDDSEQFSWERRADYSRITHPLDASYARASRPE